MTALHEHDRPRPSRRPRPPPLTSDSLAAAAPSANACPRPAASTILRRQARFVVCQVWLEQIDV
jgi:hypothetical protein